MSIDNNTIHMLFVVPFTISHPICSGPEGRHRKDKLVVGQRQIGWLRSQKVAVPGVAGSGSEPLVRAAFLSNFPPVSIKQ